MTNIALRNLHTFFTIQSKGSQISYMRESYLTKLDSQEPHLDIIENLAPMNILN